MDKKKQPSEESKGFTSASIQGRSEALQIILNLDPEEGLDEFITGQSIADSGDYSSVWDVDKLKALFHVSNEYENSPGCKIAEAADSLYWENVSKSDDMNTLKGLVKRILYEIEQGDINDGPWCAVDILKTWVK